MYKTNKRKKQNENKITLAFYLDSTRRTIILKQRNETQCVVEIAQHVDKRRIAFAHNAIERKHRSMTNQFLGMSMIFLGCSN